MQVIFVTPLDDDWGWKLAATGEHGAVGDVDGRCATHDEAVTEAQRRHPGVKIVEVDNPRSAY